MDTLDKGDVAPPKPQTQKGRTKKSIVWDHFIIMNVGNDCYRACCKQWNKSFAYSTGLKLSGTSHLKRHIDTGMCSVSQVQDNNLPSALDLKNVTISEPPKKRQRRTNGALAIPLSQKRCNNEIARMIILHGFIKFVRTLQPQFDTVSSDAILALRLREITGIAPERATRRMSMWWPEIGLQSSLSQASEES